jgi:YesN/AraC family two-component response regulator
MAQMSTQSGAPLRILFVDDEEAIRLTLPPILVAEGFSVVAVATVPEALAKIASEPFDVLIADLNVGQAGDGFTVVSAMRRTQPNCVNLILTGYPAFESALEAIRQQVDEYIVKPTDIAKLLQSIEKLRQRKPHQPLIPKRIACILREHVDEIIALASEKMKANEDLKILRLSDSERVDHLPRLIEQMAKALESHEVPVELVSGAAEHGGLRRKQKYTAPQLVEDTRALDEAIYQTVQKNLLSVDVSHLIADLGVVNSTLEVHLKESLKAFTSKAA